MKKLAILVLLAIVMLGLVGIGNGMVLGAQANETSIKPTVTVWPPIVKVDAKTELAILGSGFQPGEELYVLLKAADGSTTSIIDSLQPAPALGHGLLVDKSGNFACLLPLGRLERVQAEGVYGIAITNDDFKTITSVPIGFADPDGKSRVGLYPSGKPDYEKNPDDPRPLPWVEPFFEYPERP